jgi:hypothetical protein
VSQVNVYAEPPQFKNGWYCKRCDCLTEHAKTAKGLVCCECGCVLGQGNGADEVNAKKRAYREAHKDEVSAKQRAYREAHKDEVSAKQRAYREAHKDEVRARQREANRRYLQRKRERLQRLIESLEVGTAA